MPNSSFLDNVIVYPLGSCVVLKVVQEKGLKHAMCKSLGYFENLTGNKAILSRGEDRNCMSETKLYSHFAPLH